MIEAHQIKLKPMMQTQEQKNDAKKIEIERNEDYFSRQGSRVRSQQSMYSTMKDYEKAET